MGHVAESVAELLNRQWRQFAPSLTALSPPDSIARATNGREEESDQLVGIFCYRVAVNGPQRNFRSAVSSDGVRRLPPLPVDVHFLLTAPTKPVSTIPPLSLLGWAMRILEDRAILPASAIKSPTDSLPMLQPQESLEIVAETLPLQDQTSLWQSLQRPFRPTAAYVARMIALDSLASLKEPPLVQTRQFQHVGVES